jgi:hypothetical protein
LLYKQGNTHAGFQRIEHGGSGPDGVPTEADEASEYKEELKMPILNGKTYEMQYLTDEETAVINAMRMGGKAQVNFFRSDYENMSNHMDSLDKDIFFYRHNMDLNATSYFEAKSENVTIGHFVDK